MNFLDNIHLGTCYYPDHWPRERWQQDVDNMADMGMTILRLAELSWGALEPQEGVFQFDWLEDFIAMAGAAGIKIILGTPSEATPVWLRRQHPEIVRVNAFGQPHGERGMHCHNSQSFRYYACRITTEMVRRFGENPYVVGWQIDNEFRAVDCYCHTCKSRFQVWLRKKYKTVATLNEAWGTKFWSQNYNSFEEVELPEKKEVTISTSQVLDYKRFISFSTVDFQNELIHIIKGQAPHQFVTHNSLGLYPDLNMYDLGKELDIMAWDAYPHVDEDFVHMARCHDMMRTIKNNNFWMLEQKNGYFNFSDYNLAITPGLIRAWTMLDISRGANGVVFYRYRSNRWGQEQNPNGILRHDGTKRRAYYEIKQISKELSPICERLGKTKVQADVAIVHNYDDIWSAQAKKQYRNFDCEALETDFYKALLSLGVTADIVAPDTDFSRYKVVIAPNLVLLSNTVADNLYRYVENGGCAVFHIRAGTKDAENVVVDTAWPGLLQKLCGIRVDEFEAFPDHVQNHAVYKGKIFPIRWWADVLSSDTATPLAAYGGRFYSGAPAVTVNNYGKGEAVYFGCAGCIELIRAYMKNLMAAYNVKTFDVPEKVYISTRTGDKDKFTFLLNMDDTEKLVNPGIFGKDMITGREITGELKLAPLEILVVEEK